jgi:hypothetical protein
VGKGDFQVTVEELAYLGTPDRVRAALINTTGHAPPMAVIERKLAKVKGKHIRQVGEPVDNDAAIYTPQGIVLPDAIRERQRKAKENRAAWAKLLRESPDDKPAPLPDPASNEYRKQVVNYVLHRMGISKRMWNKTLRRYGRMQAAGAVMAKAMRDRDPLRYSYPKIASAIGRGDHTTVIYTLKAYEGLAKQFPEIVPIYDELMK